MRESELNYSPVKFTARIKQPNGKIKCTEQNINYYSNSYGKPIAMYGIVKDITDIETALSNSELDKMRFNTLINGNKEGIAITDESRRIIYITNAVTDVLGYLPQDLVGAKTFNLYHPDDKETVGQALLKAKNAPGRSFNCEVRMVHRSGRLRWVRLNITNQLNNPGVKGIVTNFADITEIKEAEDSLYKRERRYRALIENGPEVISITSLNRKLIYVSGNLKKVLGYDLDENLGNSTLGFYHPDDLATVNNAVNKIIEKGTGASETVEARIKHQNGTYRWFKLTYSNYLDLDEIRGIVTNFIDINEKKATKESLLETANFLKKALTIANMGTWYQLFENGIAVYSPETCRIYGFEEDDNNKTYDEWIASIHPDDREKVLQKIKEAETLHIAISFVARIIRKNDGAVRYVSQDTAYSLDNSGKPNGLYGIVTDITDKVNADIELKGTIYELERYQAAIDSIAMVSCKDSNGNITYVNPAFCAASKYGYHELIGKQHNIISSGHHSSDYFKDLWRIISNGNIWTGELKNKAKDGSFFWVKGSIIPIAGRNGKANEYLSLYIDITEIKEAQRKTEEMNAELDLKVAQRTAELSLKNEELETFVSSVSHDLRAPIRLINSYAGLILNRKTIQEDPARVNEILKWIMESAIRGNNIITDLLNLSRLNALDLKMKVVDMQAQVQVVLNEQHNTENQGREEITVLPMENVVADPGMIQQVWTNLISNAIKYSSKVEHPKIEIGMYKDAVEGNVYYVADNGAGFDISFTQKIFKPFQRAHRYEDFEGTGIGLSLVYSIIKKHNGKIWVTSSINQGARFFFTLGHSQPAHKAGLK